MSLSKACVLFGCSRQSVYQRLQRRKARQAELEPVKTLVHQVRKRLPRLGTRKLYYLLPRKIMGHHLSQEMRASDTVMALTQAIRQRVSDQPLMHHSDRGIQYCSSLYQGVLQRHGIAPSMTDGYDCYQNALAERISGILKQEFLVHRCRTFVELKQLIEESVEAYNTFRPHLSLGMKTPNAVHEKASGLRPLAQ